MKKIIFLISLILVTLKCSSTINPVIIKEDIQTIRDTTDNIDSPAFWSGKNGEKWIISTAKSSDCLIIDDAETGKNINRIGSKGNKLGQMDRPNGIYVIDSLAFIVERNNHRVQIFQLPEFKSIGTLGDSLLKKPYGIFVYKTNHSSYRSYITDNYNFDDKKIPPRNLLSKRVHIYTVTIVNNNLKWKFEKAFGDTSEKGALHIVESIHGDVENNLLFIAEEDTSQSSIKVYDLEGNFTGNVIGNDLFDGQIEGIFLIKCNDHTGKWIITNQSKKNNKFLIFDRTNFNYIGSFIGSNTRNTDGIWYTATPFGKFSKGAFFAVNDDGNVSVFNWKTIAQLLHIECN